MPQRTVSVGLVAEVNNYVANMRRAEAATQKLAASAVGSEKQLRAQGEVYTKLGTAALAGGAVAAAGLALVVKATADYGSKMAQLQSLSRASRSEMAQLSKAAMEQGRAYGYSASQVADAQIELVKAGFTTKQVLGGGLRGALSLAAAGQLEVSEATGIATIALTQFHQKASDLPHDADMLAAGADKALGSVHDLGEALSNGGSSAAAMGISLQDTVGVLSAFANAGIIGAEGGTQLRSMLLQLQSPSKQAKAELDRLGISAYDQQGKFVGLTSLAGQLHDKLFKASDAQRSYATSTIFGSYAVNGANVLIREGAKGIADWTSKVNEYGFANAQAAGKLNSLSGDVQKLSASFDTNLIKAGTGADTTLRGLVQTGAHLLDVVGDIPQPVVAAGVALTAGAAAVGILGGAALIAVPKILVLRREMDQAGLSGKKLAGGIGKGSAVLLGITAVGAGLSDLSTTGSASVQQLALGADQLRTKWASVDSLFKSAGDTSFATGTKGASAALQELQGDMQIGRISAQFIDNLTGITGVGTHFADVYKSNAETIDAFGQQLSGLATQDLPSAQRGFQQLWQKFKGTGVSADDLLERMPSLKDTLSEIASKAGVAATSSNLLAIIQDKGAAAAKVLAYQQKVAAADAKEHAAALDVLAGRADDGTASVKALKSALDGLDHGQLSARDAARNYQAAIDDATAALKQNGKTLDIHTAAGRDNQSRLDAVASSTKAWASQLLDAGAASSTVSRVVRTGRAEYVRMAINMGMSRAAAVKLAQSLFDIPKVVSSKIRVQVENGNAIGSVAASLRALDGKRFTTTLAIQTAQSVINLDDARAAGAGVNVGDHKAAGGAIDGPGPKGKDSVRAVLAPGEHVLTASDVDAMGGQSNVYAFRAALHMAAGGAVPKTALGTAISAGPVRRRRGSPRNAISEAVAEARAAAGDIVDDQKAVVRAKRLAAAARKEADRLRKAYEDIDGTKANRAAKKAAKAAADAADKRADRAEKRVDTTRKAREDDKKTRDDAAAKAKQLRFDREDFVSQERRGGLDPLGYVDQLRQMSRDENYSPARRKAFAEEANAYEKTIVKLNKQSEKNSDALATSTQKLEDQKTALDDANQQLESLRSTAAGVRSSISGSISGKYAQTNATTEATTSESGWIVRDGISYNTYSTDAGGAVTAASLDAYNSRAANDSGHFAEQLQQLANRGVDRAYLAEIAGDGADEGGAIASALLSANDTDFQRINNNYAATLVNSDRAGSTVADYTYGSAIASAQAQVDAAQGQVDATQGIIDAENATAKAITKQLDSDSGQLRHLIGTAFGLSGYAGGTNDATPGLHLVGENGPELVRMAGGEEVVNAIRTGSLIRGGGNPAAQAAARLANQGARPAQQTRVTMPDTITVQDLSGFHVTMRTIANQEIARDQAEDRVLLWGGAA